MKDKIKQYVDDKGYLNPDVEDLIYDCIQYLGLSNEWVGEPLAYMYQHEETGVIGFVEQQQIEWGFEKENPRLQIICPLYRLPPSEAKL